MTSALFDMTGKVALVTGSSRGIGRAIAEAFAQAGAKIVVSSRGQDACDCVAESLRAHGAEAIAIACNVSGREAVDALADEAAERLGPVDVFVGNAAANPYFGPLRGIEDTAWDKIMGTNVRSNLWLCNRVIPGMAERGEGAVILVSSIAAFTGDAVLGAYAVSKAAEIQLVRSLAVEWGPTGVRVNAIAPGLVRTDFARALWEDDARRTARERVTPPRRAGGYHRRRGLPRIACRCVRHRPMHRRRWRRDGCGSEWIACASETAGWRCTFTGVPKKVKRRIYGH